MLIIDFILIKNADNSICEKIKSVIIEAFNKGNLKGLREVSRDMNAWAKGLPQKDIKELELLLAEKFGENLSGDNITLKVIEQVLKKEEIQNEEHYRVVYEYLQDISHNDPFFENIAELERLLQHFKNKC